MAKTKNLKMETSSEDEVSIDDIVNKYTKRAKGALTELNKFTQEQVDAIAHEFALVIFNQAEKWARMTVDESGLGNVPDKISKKRNKAEGIWNEIKDARTVGVIERDYDKRLMKIVEPVGVVAGVCPCTNPVVTAMSYALLCIKTRNALIISAHPRAVDVTCKVVEEMAAAGAKYDLPQNAIQMLEQDAPDINMLELSRLTMAETDMVIATGGPKLVEVAYQSGTPAYGVGAGNTPIIVHESANLADAAEKVIIGRSFDNGIICASEQHLIVPRNKAGEFITELEKNGAYFVESAQELQKLNECILDKDNHFNSAVAGQSVQKIARMADIQIPENVRVLVVKRWFEEIGSDPYSGEKMFPLLSWYVYDDFADAVSWADRLLSFQGKGHTAGLHISDRSFQAEKDILYWSSRVSATHLLVNQATAVSAGGSKFNYMTASTTLGCGAYGGTMPMESINLSVKQLLNYKTVAMPLPHSRSGYHLL